MQTLERSSIIVPTVPAEPPPAPPVLPRLGAILRRRWPLLVVLPLLACVIAGINYVISPRTYTATGSVTVTDQSPLPQDPQYAEYYRNLSSEAATDDLTKIILGSRFADDVTARLQANNTPIPLKEVKAALSTTRVFRVLTINTADSDHGRAVNIARAALDTLVAKAPDYFPNRPVMVSVINAPTEASLNTLKAKVLAVGTVFAALLAAIVIALILEWFDPRLHDRRDVEDMLGVPVIGAIPPATRAGKAA